MAEYCRLIFGDALLMDPLEKYPVMWFGIYQITKICVNCCLSVSVCVILHTRPFKTESKGEG